MAQTAKIRSLVTRSAQSCDLAFEVAGVLDWQNPALRVGARIAADKVIDPDAIRTFLARRGNDDARTVEADELAMVKFLSPATVFRLRNFQEQAELSQAIASRDIQVLRTYRRLTEIANLVVESAKESAATASQAAKAREAIHSAIQKAYSDEPPDSTWKGVKKGFATIQATEGESISDLFMTPTGLQTPGYAMSAVPAGGGTKQTVDEVISKPVLYDPAATGWVPVDSKAATGSKARLPEFYAQRSISREDKQLRKSLNDGQGFWHPQLESLLDFLKDKDALLAEKLGKDLALISVEKLQAVLERELRAQEAEVLRVQGRLLATFLLCPFEGQVTAVYKDVGEYVQAGEPVARVENDRKLVLFGHVLFRGAVKVGNSVVVQCKNIYQSGNSFSANGTVVSVRGHSADDDEWELLIELSAPASLPLNFGFDPTDTTLQIG